MTGQLDVDAMVDEAREEGFALGVAATDCDCPHADDCPRSGNYRPGLLGRLRSALRGEG